jgi:hypothetical protein
MKNVSTDELHVGVGVRACVCVVILNLHNNDSSYFLHYITLWIDHIAHRHRLSPLHCRWKSSGCCFCRLSDVQL